jgi:RNA polymerase sigma factor (sigma-70 family)
MNQSNNLNYLTDVSLIEKIKCENCNDSMKELESRHSGICFSMIKKYYNSMSCAGIDPNEVAKEKNYIIYKSALNFDVTKNVKFCTWLGNQMRYHCLNSMNKNSNTLNMENDSIKMILEKRQAQENTFLSNEDNYNFIFNLLGQFKDDRITKIFKIRYFTNKKNVSWSKIGKELNISTQTVINLHNRTLKFLKNKLESNNFQDTI